MSAVLVTGGTGRLGRVVVPRLTGAGHHVTVLSRRKGTNSVVGDLTTGAGLDAALEGADLVLHLATANGAKDVEMTRVLVEHAAKAGVRHLVLVSIVGVDRIPLPYYRHKLAAEEVALSFPVPITVQRATQFHELLRELFSAQRFLPVLLTPALTLQPIDTGDVAARLVDLIDGPPQGRAQDIGGPETLTGRQLVRIWMAARGIRRPCAQVSLPGRAFAAFAAGGNLVPGVPYGTTTFADYLARH